MHPEITSRLAAHRRAELANDMSRIHNARLHNEASHATDSQVPGTPGRRGLGWLRALRPGLAASLSGARRRPTAPVVLVAEPEAFGVRAYLTSSETRQLMAEWAQQVARYADRLDDPGRRPAGAQPFELLILGRQLPAFAAAPATGQLSASD